MRTTDKEKIGTTVDHIGTVKSVDRVIVPGMQKSRAREFFPQLDRSHSLDLDNDLACERERLSINCQQSAFLDRASRCKSGKDVESRKRELSRRVPGEGSSLSDVVSSTAERDAVSEENESESGR